jgi:multidrug resistance efflux pump
MSSTTDTLKIAEYTAPTMDYFIETQLKFTNAMADCNYRNKIAHEKLKKDHDALNSAHTMLQEANTQLQQDHDALLEKTMQLEKELQQAKEMIKTTRLFNQTVFTTLMEKAVGVCIEKSLFEKTTVVAESNRAGKKQKLAQ